MIGQSQEKVAFLEVDLATAAVRRMAEIPGISITAACAILAEIGTDTGFDSIGDWPQLSALGAYLDKLDQENALPKTIVYNLNPADNDAMAAMTATTTSQRRG
jgi:glucuronate isomerase